MSWKKWKGTIAGAVAAPFTGGLSLAAGYLYDTNKQQNEANKKALSDANAYSMYTWDLANQYNDPSSQMARLKAAGLNPNLVYGSGNVTGNTTSVASSNGVATENTFNAIEKGLPLAQSLANLRNVNSQNELLKYQMGQTAAQTAYTQARTQDLNNFLSGSGPTTHSGASLQTPSTLEPASNYKDNYEDDIVELAPKSARPMTRRAIGWAKWVGKQYGNEVGNFLSWFSPRKSYDQIIFEKRQNYLDNAYKSGKISRRRYIDETYF